MTTDHCYICLEGDARGPLIQCPECEFRVHEDCYHDQPMPLRQYSQCPVGHDWTDPLATPNYRAMIRYWWTNGGKMMVLLFLALLVGVFGLWLGMAALYHQVSYSQEQESLRDCEVYKQVYLSWPFTDYADATIFHQCRKVADE